MEPRELGDWLRRRDAKYNLYTDATLAEGDGPVIHVVPCTLLAAQAVLAETWIINDPALESTHYCYHTSLVPDHAWLSVELLEHVRGLNGGTRAHYG